MTNSSPNSLEKIDRAYSSEPWWYDIRGFLILTFAYRSTLPAQIRLFSSNMGPEHLEAAIGTGTLFELILRYRRFKKMIPSNVTGFDYADRMLAGAQHRFQNEPSVKLLRADIGSLPFESERFDTINIANAIHCLPDVAGGFRECHRVLKPNGTMAGNVLLEPKNGSVLMLPLVLLARRINQWGMKKGLLERPYEVAEIRGLLLGAGFKMVNENVSGNCYEFTVKK